MESCGRQGRPDRPTALAEPCGTLNPHGTLPLFSGTFMEPYLAEPGATLVQMANGWKPQTLVEPQTTPDHPAALEQPGGTLLEPWWWNLHGALPCRTWCPANRPSNLTPNHPGPPQLSWNPGRTFMVEPSWNPCGTLVEPYLKALEEPRGTLLEPWWWNLHGTLPCRTWWNPGGTLVEPWWNPGGTRGTLVEPHLKPPRTTPQPLQICQGRPGPPRSLSGLRPQSFQLLGKNTE